jgi:hypothetical protein
MPVPFVQHACAAVVVTLTVHLEGRPIAATAIFATPSDLPVLLFAKAQLPPSTVGTIGAGAGVGAPGGVGGIGGGVGSVVGLSGAKGGPAPGNAAMKSDFIV